MPRAQTWYMWDVCALKQKPHILQWVPASCPMTPEISACAVVECEGCPVWCRSTDHGQHRLSRAPHNRHQSHATLHLTWMALHASH